MNMLTGWDSPRLSQGAKKAITQQLEPFFAFLPGSLRSMLKSEMAVQVLGEKTVVSPTGTMVAPVWQKDESAPNAKEPEGQPEGQPDGQPDGHPEGHPEGQPKGQDSQDSQDSRDEHGAHGARNYVDGADGVNYRLTISLAGARMVAMAFGVELRDAYLFCMAHGLWPLRFVRNAGSLTLQEQEFLLRSRVTIVGCGALGGFVSMLLARIGIGSLVLCDDDVFEETNLNRQLFCDEKSLGRPKVEVAQQKLREVASHLLVTPFPERATRENLPHILTGSHILVDCVDSVAARIIMDEAAVAQGIPYIHGAVAGYEGFCGVSCVIEGDGLVRQLYGNDTTMRDDKGVIEEAGLFASTPASIACLQALFTVQTLLAGFHGEGMFPLRLVHLDLQMPSLTCLSL